MKKVARILVIATLAAMTLGQRAPTPNEPGKELNQGVYVRDSGGAVEKLALAERMSRLKEWEKAADLYQEVLDKYSDRIVSVDKDGAAGSRYANVTAVVQERLAVWPAEGLEVYHRRFESAAAALLEAAGIEDAATLNQICARYFATTAGKTAAIRLVELDIENGDFAAGAWMGERLLAYHPELGAQRAQVLFVTGLAEHLGTDAAVQAKADELKQKFPQATGNIRGKDVVLADELANVIKTPAPVAHRAPADGWPMFGGDATRGRISGATGRVGAKQRQIMLSKHPSMPVLRAPIRQRAQLEERQLRIAGLSLGVMPVMDRGALFFQDNQYIYARNVESGMALPGWLATYPGEQDGKYSSSMQPMPSNTQMTVTVADRSVLAVVRQFERIPTQDGAGAINDLLQPNGETKMVCLDRATGIERWAVTPRQFADQNLKQLELSGSPVVVGDNVYINARGGKPMQFEESYVLCLGAGDGKLRWACYLASGNAAGNMMGFTSTPNNASHIAYDGGRLYVSTELGAVASVDAFTGQIVWLNLYPRPQQNFAAMQAGMQQPNMTIRKPWSQNPVIVKDGKVFAMPSDSRHALIYEAGTGKEIKRILMDTFDGARTLLGVNGNQLIVNSDVRVFCINWEAFAPEKAPEDELHWKVGPLVGTDAGADRNSDTIRGRGFVTADSVFITTQWRLHRISLKGGKTEDTYPAKLGVWSVDEGPGNVLVTQDHVIIAGADSVDIYTDMALARARLDQAVQAKPNEPSPRLEYAEVMFASGQFDLAMGKLDEAIGLLGGVQSMRPGPERDRVFSDSLAFAQRMSDPRTSTPERMAQTDPMFDRAASAAYSPQQHVSYRESRARFAHTKHDFATELRLWQEVLAQSPWRNVMVMREGAVPAAAWMIAERAVIELVRTRRELYDPYEKLAADALAAAMNAHDAEQLKNVAQVFPVAKVAPDALFAAAEAYELSNNPRQATRVLNQIYRKYLSVDKSRVIEAQARNYLALPGGVGIAIGRLLEGARLGNAKLKQPIKMPDGTALRGSTFAEAANLLQQFSSQLASATLPDFKLKMPRGDGDSAFLPEKPETLISDVDKLLKPDRDLQSYARNDRLVTWATGKGLSIYPIGKNQPLGTDSQIKDPPKGIAWAGNDLVVWSTDAAGKLTLVSGDHAATKWELSVKALPKLEVTLDEQATDESMGPANALEGNGLRAQAARIAMQQRRLAIQAARAPEAGETIEHVLPIGDRVIVGTSTGRVLAVELSNGQIAWQARVAELGIDQLLANDDFVAVRMIGDVGAEIVAMEAVNGQVVMRRSFAETPPQNMALAPDGTLVWSMPDRVFGKDLYEPEKVLKFGDRVMSGGGQMFNGAIAADQLVVTDGKILALSDMGQMVRVLSLEGGRDIGQPIATKASASDNWNVWLRVLGPRLYIVSRRTVCGRNLNDVDDTWDGQADLTAPVMSEAFFGKKHVVLLGQVTPANVPMPGAARHWLTGYSRAPVGNGSTRESGMLEFSEPVIHPAGIDQWQPVDGGFYYRTLDRKLHFLQGAGE